MLFYRSKDVIWRIYRYHFAGLKMLILTLVVKFSGLRDVILLFKCHFTSHGYMPFEVHRCHHADLRTPFADLKIQFYGRYESFKML